MSHEPASRVRRFAALLIDLSLFAALGIALSPLLPPTMGALAVAGLAGFVVLVSYYYFVGTWMLWGKTIGGAIFEVSVSGPMSIGAASLRWLGVFGAAVAAAAAAGVLIYLMV